LFGADQSSGEMSPATRGDPGLDHRRGDVALALGPLVVDRRHDPGVVDLPYTGE